MSTETLLRAFALCVVLAGTETLHGIARTLWLVPRIGKARATAWSALSGTLLAAAVCAALLPGLGLTTMPARWALGAGLAVWMAAFDMAMGRWVMRRPWAKIWPDFNPATGNFLAFGLVALALLPAALGWAGIA